MAEARERDILIGLDSPSHPSEPELKLSLQLVVWADDYPCRKPLPKNKLRALSFHPI